MTVDEASPWVSNNFLALTPEQSDPETAAAVLIPVPYDSTTSYRTGARYGPAAILSASYNLEDYDHELDIDLSDAGIHTTAALEPHMAGPDAMIRRVAEAVERYDDGRRLVGLLGGEHSIAVGAVRAMKQRRPNSLSSIWTPTATCATPTWTRPTATPALPDGSWKSAPSYRWESAASAGRSLSSRKTLRQTCKRSCGTRKRPGCQDSGRS